ncbi:MAG: hypothetical protein JO307_01635, partial [Bryobacterales bacterium]|nr:hypothetical protein [Bryobacterales bacterium]
GGKQDEARNDTERQLQQVERLRNQLQGLAQRGQQPGNQNGQGKEGGQQPGNQNSQGNQGGGNQAGGNQAGNANGGGNFVNPNGGAYNGGPLGPRPYVGPNGGYAYDPRLGMNRQYPLGIYDVPDERNVQPGQVGRDIQRQLQDLRAQYKDDPDIARQVSQMQAELDKMQVGDIASPELAQRISRTILPQLETLEVQLRRELEEKGTGQARSAANDKVPAGYGEAWQEYTRKLSTNK